MVEKLKIHKAHGDRDLQKKYNKISGFNAIQQKIVIALIAMQFFAGQPEANALWVPMPSQRMPSSSRPPACLLLISPRPARFKELLRIDATGAWDQMGPVASNVVRVFGSERDVLLESDGNEVIFFRFPRRGRYVINNEVISIEGFTTICEVELAVK